MNSKQIIQLFYHKLNLCIKRFIETSDSIISIPKALPIEIGNGKYKTFIQLELKLWGTICENVFINFINDNCKDIFYLCEHEPNGPGKFPDMLISFKEKDIIYAFGAEIKTSEQNQINCGLQHAYTLCLAINESSENNISEHLETPFIIFKYHQIEQGKIKIDDIIIKEYWKMIAITKNNNFGFKTKNVKTEGRYFQNFASFKERFNKLKIAALNYLKNKPNDLEINSISKPYNLSFYKNLLK